MEGCSGLINKECKVIDTCSSLVEVGVSYNWLESGQIILKGSQLLNSNYTAVTVINKIYVT